MRAPDLRRREEGSILVFVVITIGVLIAGFAFAIDIGRAWSLNSELQQAADAAALAGAKELNRQPDAMDRARLAARGGLTPTLETPLTNDQRLHMAGFSSVAINTEITFHETVNGAAITGNDPDDNARARFIKVRTESYTVLGRFMRIVGAEGMLATEARATAGNTRVACKITPLMMCSPRPNGAGFDDTYPIRGQQFVLLQQGDWQQPGNFGLLTPPDIGGWQNKQEALVAMLASPSPPVCFVSELETEPGVHNGPMSTGINVRFDLYPNGWKADDIAKLPPAPNPIRGVPPKNSACSVDEKPDFTDTASPMPLPRDLCYESIDGQAGTPGLCDTSTPVFKNGEHLAGNGSWSGNGRADKYFLHNWGVSPAPALINGKTRYEVWQMEQDPTFPATIGATKTPPDFAEGSCFADQTSQAVPADADRRIIYVAVVDCLNNPFSGKSGLPLEGVTFARFFVTEPVLNPDARIWAEYIDYIKTKDLSQVIRDMVQLYE